LRVSAGDVARGADGSSIVYEGKVIPFAPLARSLRATASHARAWSAVVVEGSRALAAVGAVGVDRLRGAQNVVLRPLPRLTIADPVVLGASFDADGSPQIVLDPERLVADARVSETAEAAPVDGRLPVLIIDDSMTTRMLEQSILEAAGYQVELAASGEEALDMARPRTRRAARRSALPPTS
jgi:two-component system chemotaxis sensor kinase CheA